jgi:signal transduction histidine kinase
MRVDSGVMLAEVIELHRALAAERGIELDVQLDRAPVTADPVALRRVLQNLVTNAFEAMPRGGRLAARSRVDGDTVRLELRDSGEGLSAEAQAKLFEPYFTTRSKGTGLGLAIAKRVIEDLGGEISLANAQPGPGVVVRVSLPCRSEA